MTRPPNKPSRRELKAKRSQSQGDCIGKRRYTGAEARRALQRATKTGSATKPARAYPCRLCGYWHLTSSR